jgi:hypothetical protein
VTCGVQLLDRDHLEWCPDRVRERVGTTPRVPVSLPRARPGRGTETAEPAETACGVHLFRRRKSTGATWRQWVPCKRRTCPQCRPEHAAHRVAAIPEDVQLYVAEPGEWETRRKQLSRRRARGEAGEYLRVGDRALVTDAPIGEPVPRNDVIRLIEETPSTAGNITVSKSWQPPPLQRRQTPRAAASDDEQVSVEVIEVDVDTRVPTGSGARFDAIVCDVGFETKRVDREKTRYETMTAEDFERIIEACHAVDLCELAQARARHRRRPSGRAVATRVAA